MQRYFSVCEFYFFVLHTLYLYSFFLFFAFSVSFCSLTFMRVDLLYYSARLSTINFQCYQKKDLKSRFNRFFILASKLHVNTITVSCVKIISYCWIKLVVTLLYPSSTKVLITSMHTFGCYSTYMLGLSWTFVSRLNFLNQGNTDTSSKKVGWSDNMLGLVQI